MTRNYYELIFRDHFVMGETRKLLGRYGGNHTTVTQHNDDESGEFVLKVVTILNLNTHYHFNMLLNEYPGSIEIV